MSVYTACQSHPQVSFLIIYYDIGRWAIFVLQSGCSLERASGSLIGGVHAILGSDTPVTRVGYLEVELVSPSSSCVWGEQAALDPADVPRVPNNRKAGRQCLFCLWAS